jgi:hypothetical protein
MRYATVAVPPPTGNFTLQARDGTISWVVS